MVEKSIVLHWILKKAPDIHAITMQWKIRSINDGKWVQNASPQNHYYNEGKCQVNLRFLVQSCSIFSSNDCLKCLKEIPTIFYANHAVKPKLLLFLKRCYWTQRDRSLFFCPSNWWHCKNLNMFDDLIWDVVYSTL